MVIGVLKLTFAIDAAHSLKAKRKVIRSLIERARHKFNCSVAEVDAHDTYNRAVVGVTVVANDSSFVNSMLDKILDAFEEDAIGRAEIVDSQLEIMHV